LVHHFSSSIVVILRESLHAGITKINAFIILWH
jgi:hypothetical protein